MSFKISTAFAPAGTVVASWEFCLFEHRQFRENNITLNEHLASEDVQGKVKDAGDCGSSLSLRGALWRKRWGGFHPAVPKKWPWTGFLRIHVRFKSTLHLIIPRTWNSSVGDSHQARAVCLCFHVHSHRAFGYTQ